jgi:type IV pilus assembly protein PilC
VLGRLSRHYEERAEVEEKLKSALIYPVFVTVLCVLSLVVLFIFVLPGFKSLFLDLDADLPVFTGVILGAGDIMSKFWYVPFLTLLVSGTLFLRYKRSERGSKVIDALLLKFKLVSSGQVMHGFRTLGSLLQAGIPISAALASTVSASQNLAFKKVMLEIKESVENGERLSEILSRYRMFPSAAVQMIRVGENSGTLAEMLLNIAGFFEKEKEIFIKRVTSLLEPALTLTVGIMVGVIALAVFLPMINMISSLQ